MFNKIQTLYNFVYKHIINGFYAIYCDFTVTNKGRNNFRVCTTLKSVFILSDIILISVFALTYGCVGTISVGLNERKSSRISLL